MFKKAQYVQAASVSPNALSLTITGRISLSKHFIKSYGVHKGMGVELYWDEVESKIGLIFMEEGRPGAFPLGFVPNGQAAYVIATQFFRSCGLDPEKYAAPYGFEVVRSSQLGVAGEGDAFVIDLKKPEK